MSIQPFYSFFKMIRAPPVRFLKWLFEILKSFFSIIYYISWEEIRSYIRYLKDVRYLNPRTINVHIAQLRDFYQYVLHRDWDRYQVPYLHYDQLLPRVPDKQQINAVIDSLENLKQIYAP